tara:strand:- start:166 stop:708 length:543 start_codon:yes stop_codon:yes gene_type:complete
MSRNNKEITELIWKYQEPNVNVRTISDLILKDINYLEEHSERTCKQHYTIIPNFPIEVYGDRGPNYLFKEALIYDDHNAWCREYNGYSLVLSEIIEDILTMTRIIGKIFCHEKDKEAKSREELSNINIEFIKDFVILNKYFICTYLRDISKRIGTWTSYSHCERYCDKIKNFLEELKKCK